MCMVFSAIGGYSFLKGAGPCTGEEFAGCQAGCQAISGTDAQMCAIGDNDSDIASALQFSRSK